jgi:hypothetical protein
LKNIRLKPVDIIVIIGVLIFALFFIFYGRGNEKKLVLISGDQKTYLMWKTQTRDLNDIAQKNMIVEVENGRARVVSSDCPDKICVNSGWVQNCGQVAACLPNGVLIMVECLNEKP